MDQLAAAKDATKLRTYNHTTITQLSRCKVEIKNNDKCRKCTFFVVPGNGEALFSMPDIELLNILNINCNTMGTDKEEKRCELQHEKNSVLSAGSEQCCTNIGPERSGAKTNNNTSSYTNIGSNSNLNNRPDDVLTPAVNNK